MRKNFPARIIVALILLLAIVNAAAFYWKLYFFIWWFDIPMHFLGGLWIGLASLAAYYGAPHPRRKDTGTFFVVTLSVAVVMIIGLAWELFELSSQTFIERATVHDLTDTLSDLTNDLIGALVAAWIFIRGGYNAKI